VQWHVGGVPSSSDFYLWQDQQTDALWMKHNGAVGRTNGEFVARLSDDYLTVANTSQLFGGNKGFTEGGGIFFANNKSYVMAGYGCCFCPAGSNGFLWSAPASDPLGHYTLEGDKVARLPNGSSVTQAQWVAGGGGGARAARAPHAHPAPKSSREPLLHAHPPTPTPPLSACAAGSSAWRQCTPRLGSCHSLLGCASAPRPIG